MHTAPRVLLAEDDDDLREALACALRSRGFEVTEVSSGRAVESYLDDCVSVDVVGPRIHVLITDLCMPGADAIVLLDRLRSLGWDLPTVVITAYADAETKHLLSAMGAQSVLEKPLDLDHLERIVKDALEVNRDACV